MSFPQSDRARRRLRQERRRPGGHSPARFGFTEVGTLTPKPQAGNPKPRLFRLVEDEAVINRFGFNNEGHARRWPGSIRIDPVALVGVNIGANKDAVDRVADYVAGVKTFYRVARYFTANISSPNTPAFATCRRATVFANSCRRACGARRGSGQGRPACACFPQDRAGSHRRGHGRHRRGGAGEPSRRSDRLQHHAVARGLARPAPGRRGGRHVRQAVVRQGHRGARAHAQALGPDFPIIGVGGVDSAETAAEKIRAGADLVQLYSAMVYGGPACLRASSPGFRISSIATVSLRSARSAIPGSITGWREKL